MVDVNTSFKRENRVGFGKKEGWLCAVSNLPNAAASLKISIYVTDDAIRTYFGLSETSEVTLKSVSSFFGERNIDKKVNLILVTIQWLIKKKGGYPSTVHNSEECEVIFDNLRSTASFQYSRKNSFRVFKISVDVLKAKKGGYFFNWVLKHELFHGVSQAAENEIPVLKLLIDYSKREERLVSKSYDLLDQQAQKLVEFLKQPDVLSIISKHKGLAITKVPRRKIKALIVNYFADSMLTMVAMEFGDDAYVKHAVERDEEFVGRFKSLVKAFLDIRTELEKRKRAASDSYNRRVFRIHQTLVILIELFLFLDHFPFRGTPVLLLEDFRGGKNPYKYASNHTKKHIFERAEAVWEDYVSAVDDCHASVDMKRLIRAYGESVKDNVPLPSAPVDRLHAVPHKYEEVAEFYDNLIFKYFEILTKNIENLAA